MIFYTNRFIPKRYDALFLCAIGVPLWVILIRPESKDDAGLLAHELKHRDEFKKRPWSYAVRMLFNKGFRFDQEVMAYAHQLKYAPPGDHESAAWRYAGFISENYGLPVSKEEAHEAIMRFCVLGEFR